MPKFTDIAKFLLKNKDKKAVLNRFNDGFLYYQIELVGTGIEDLEDGTYEIKVPTNIEEAGNAIFWAEMPGNELNRYIRQTIESGEFVKQINI